MAQLKVCTWNIEWLDKLLDKMASPPGLGASAGVRRSFDDAQARLRAIRDEIQEIDAHVLRVIEGPNGEQAINDFCRTHLGGTYVPVLLPEGSYRQKGRQWIWFLVRPALAAQAQLHDPAVWQTYTRAESTRRHGINWTHGKTWPVNKWGEVTTTKHSHYRHPQVMRLGWQGVPLEFIGAHLKSKFVRVGRYNPESPDDPRHREFIEKAIEARIKLATEAADIRYYLGHRFGQETDPAIFLMGDFNDGPGKELFERQYLFFDLISNLQGDVFFARKFLNHALFDYPDDLRWLVFFRDRIDPDRRPEILLDHILFTQALVNNRLPVSVNPGGARVEHEVHDRINAGLTNNQKTSDHRPVSCFIDG